MRVGLAIVSTISLIVIAAYAKTSYDLRSQLPAFERLVAEQRLKQAGRGPVRMVVYYKDRSLFILTNIFEQVIYDETDQIGRDPDTLTGFWPYPYSSKGLINVGYGDKSVDHIDGHFYHVWISDP